MEDCSSSSNSINEIRSTKKRKRHSYNLRSCRESNFCGRFSSIEFQMTQEWNKKDDLFINSLKVQIAKCVRSGTTFSANNWNSLRNSLSIPKELMMTRLKKLRAKALLFKQLLAEEHVSYSHETGILSLPNYFWEDGINEVKYGGFKKEMNFQSLNEWCRIFDSKKLPLDDDTRSVNKRQHNEVMVESSKKSKSSQDCDSMEMKQLLQCDEILKNWKISGYISMLGSMKLHGALKDRGDAKYFIDLDLIEDRWCYASESLRKVASEEKRDITNYIIKDVN